MKRFPWLSLLLAGVSSLSSCQDAESEYLYPYLPYFEIDSYTFAISFPHIKKRQSLDELTATIWFGVDGSVISRIRERGGYPEEWQVGLERDIFDADSVLLSRDTLLEIDDLVENRERYIWESTNLREEGVYDVGAINLAATYEDSFKIPEGLSKGFICWGLRAIEADGTRTFLLPSAIMDYAVGIVRFEVEGNECTFNFRDGSFTNFDALGDIPSTSKGEDGGDSA